MNKQILDLLNKNARMKISDIADITDLSTEEISKEIEEMENCGLIRGYKALIDWEKIDTTSVSAIIELKVTPKADFGFEEVAARISNYPEVESVYLMSGTYDLNVVVKGETLQQVSHFVARELATIESVVSTSTHFVMRRYKELGTKLCVESVDEREIVSL